MDELCNSDDIIYALSGGKWLEDVAYEQAEQVMIDNGVEEVIMRRQGAIDSKKAALIQKYDALKAKVQKVRDSKFSTLQGELSKLKEDKHLVKDGYLKSAIDHRIQALTVELASLPENIQLQDLQAELERKCQLLEDGMYESDSENTSDVDSSEFSSTDESPEAERWRRKLQRR